MVLLQDGNSEIGGYVSTNICEICLRHLQNKEQTTIQTYSP